MGCSRGREILVFVYAECINDDIHANFMSDMQPISEVVPMKGHQASVRVVTHSLTVGLNEQEIGPREVYATHLLGCAECEQFLI